MAGITYSPRAVPSLLQDLSQGGLIQGEATDRCHGEVVGHPVARAETPCEQRGAGRRASGRSRVEIHESRKQKDPSLASLCMV